MRSWGPNIGRVIGDYQIHFTIDCGAFGCVYFAKHVLLPRNAAIKLMHSVHLASSRQQERFLQEAQILEMLKHPHILEIYNFGIDDEIPYLVTEYAPNGSLRSLLDRHSAHPWSVNQAVSIVSQIGYALQYAHKHNIIHHDLKPANILFNKKNEVLLADFGISIVQTASTMIRPTASMGTPIYMAPEQFNGRVGQRSDQYSLGCIAYELVTGQPPFNAPNNVAIGLLHLNAKPLPPKEINPQVPLYIEEAILKAIEKQSTHRHDDVATFLRALQSPNSLIRSHVILSPVKQWFNQGVRLGIHQRFEAALAAFEQAIRLDPLYAEAHYCKGNMLKHLKRFEEALVAYEQAIRLRPNYSDAYYGKGFALYCLRRYKDALVNYRHVLILDPKLIQAHYGKGVTLYHLEHYEEALISFELAIELKPDYIAAYKAMGYTLYRLKRYEEAIAYYRQAIQLDPTQPINYYNIGNALKRLGRLKEARRVYKKARQLGFRK